MVNHKNVTGTFCDSSRKSQLLLESCEDARPAAIVSVRRGVQREGAAPRQIRPFGVEFEMNVERARDAGLIKHWVA